MVGASKDHRVLLCFRNRQKPLKQTHVKKWVYAVVPTLRPPSTGGPTGTRQGPRLRMAGPTRNTDPQVKPGVPSCQPLLPRPRPGSPARSRAQAKDGRQPCRDGRQPCRGSKSSLRTPCPKMPQDRRQVVEHNMGDERHVRK